MSASVSAKLVAALAAVMWLVLSHLPQASQSYSSRSGRIDAPSALCSLSPCLRLPDTAGNPVNSISVLQRGGRADWSPSGNNLIAFERINSDGYADVYTMTPTGAIVNSITDGNTNIAQLNNGNPVWDPSGKYIVFQSEAPVHSNAGSQGVSTYGPGSGIFNDLWAATPDGSQFWKLTDIPIKQNLYDGLPTIGSYNPQFSHDGTKLVWAEYFAGGGKLGEWRLKMANFVDDAAGPHLANVTVLLQQHRNPSNYVVPMAFSPDDSKLLVAGNLDGQDVYGMDEYLLDLRNGQYTNLTNTPTAWEEDACWSPSGNHIVYMSAQGSTLDFANRNFRWQNFYTDWWMMDPDGSHKVRLTYFNDPSSPEYVGQGKRAIVADCSFSPDGRYMVGHYRVLSGRGSATTPPEKAPSAVVRLGFTNPL